MFAIAGDGVARFFAPDIAAFSTWLKVGLMPQARQGGSGVCAFAADGSKLEGTGLEKLQIVQTHVAAVTVGDSVGGLYGDPECAGEPAALLEELEALDNTRV